ncbi:MAG: ECF transporter S component [Oscillospiraceae bacterium]|nr:ECF transporter S component [Oscillospiraceae bacterium]
MSGERIKNNKRWDTKKLTVLAMLTALAFLVALIRIPTGLFILRYEAKDVVIVIGGFLFGPLAVVAMSVVLSLLEMLLLSDTGWFGFMMNVIATCSFAGTAAVIYKFRRTLGGAAIALAAGIVVNVPVMLLWNYLIVPIFTPHIAREQVVGMLVPVFLPFNLIKGGLNAALTMIVYKPIRTALDKSRLLPVSANSTAKSAKLNIGALIVSVFVLITCVLLILTWRGVIFSDDNGNANDYYYEYADNYGDGD